MIVVVVASNVVIIIRLGRRLYFVVVGVVGVAVLAFRAKNLMS